MSFFVASPLQYVWDKPAYVFESMTLGSRFWTPSIWKKMCQEGVVLHWLRLPTSPNLEHLRPWRSTWQLPPEPNPPGWWCHSCVIDSLIFLMFTLRTGRYGWNIFGFVRFELHPTAPKGTWTWWFLSEFLQTRCGLCSPKSGSIDSCYLCLQVCVCVVLFVCA